MCLQVSKPVINERKVNHLVEAGIAFVLSDALILKPSDQVAHGMFTLSSQTLLQLQHLTPALLRHLFIQLILLLTLLLLHSFLRLEDAELLEILHRSNKDLKLFLTWLSSVDYEVVGLTPGQVITS